MPPEVPADLRRDLEHHKPSGAIIRLEPDDVVGLIRYVGDHSAAVAG
jgi:hypothetical protein